MGATVNHKSLVCIRKSKELRLHSGKTYDYVVFLHIFSFKSPIYGRFLSEKATLLCALSTHKGVRPDALVYTRLPVETIFTENFSKNTIAIPNFVTQ